MRGIGTKAARIEFLRRGIKSLRKLISGRVLSVNLVAQSPRDNGGVVAVALDHLPQLLQAVLHNFRQRVGVFTESVVTPGWNFALQQDAVAVTVIEDTTILLPMHPAEDAIQILQVIVIVRDPSSRFGHTKFGVAAV